MRPNSVSPSLAIAQWYLSNPLSRRFVVVVLVTIALALISMRILRRVTAHHASPTSPQASSDANIPTGSAFERLQGNWDLLWKDEHGSLLRTPCRILQEGKVLTLWVSDPQQLRLDPRTPIKGIVESKTVSFQVKQTDGPSVMFVGTIDNGILHGTTSQGLSWMAMKR